MIHTPTEGPASESHCLKPSLQIMSSEEHCKSRAYQPWAERAWRGWPLPQALLMDGHSLFLFICMCVHLCEYMYPRAPITIFWNVRSSFLVLFPLSEVAFTLRGNVGAHQGLYSQQGGEVPSPSLSLAYYLLQALFAIEFLYSRYQLWPAEGA